MPTPRARAPLAPLILVAALPLLANGMREVQLFNVDEGLDLACSDIEELTAGWRYRVCAHDTEPGCAVKDAVAASTRDPIELASFQKLRAEPSGSAGRRIHWRGRRRPG